MNRYLLPSFVPDKDVTLNFVGDAVPVWVWAIVGVLALAAIAAGGFFLMRPKELPPGEVPDLSNMVLDNYDNAAEVVEPEMQIMDVDGASTG